MPVALRPRVTPALARPRANAAPRAGRRALAVRAYKRLEVRAVMCMLALCERKCFR